LWDILRGEPLHGLYHRGQAGSPAVPADGQSVRQRGGVRASGRCGQFGGELRRPVVVQQRGRQ